jgi:hypothetical protein
VSMAIDVEVRFALTMVFFVPKLSVGVAMNR